jgi:hypothetical protein
MHATLRMGVSCLHSVQLDKQWLQHGVAHLNGLLVHVLGHAAQIADDVAGLTKVELHGSKGPVMSQ